MWYILYLDLSRDNKRFRIFIEKIYELIEMGLSMKLLEKVSLETKAYDQALPIDKFDLIESKRISEEEKEYFMNNYDIMQWKKE